MKRSTFVIVILLGLVVLVGGWGISRYNALVRDSEAVDGQWAQVENQLQRRADLIPNLVETVKGYASHEEGVFTDIANARAKLAGASTVQEAEGAASEFESALSRLLVVVENYPTLKADTQFLSLMDQLEGTENRLATERMRFNEMVRDFNTKVKQFPTSILAGIMGFGDKAYFEPTPGAANVPQVGF